VKERRALEKGANRSMSCCMKNCHRQRRPLSDSSMLVGAKCPSCLPPPLLPTLLPVQERLTTEIEEVARSEEVQMCVDRVQQFVHDIEDIGVAVAQHNDAIERAAANLAEMGSEFEGHVEDLRQGAIDMNVQVEGIMGSMNEEVTKVVASMEEGLVGKAVEKVSVIAVAKATEAATAAAQDLISKIPAGSGVPDSSHGRGGGKRQDRISKSSKGAAGHDKEGRQGSARSAAGGTDSDADEQPAEDFDLGALVDKDSSSGQRKEEMDPVIEPGETHRTRTSAGSSPSVSRSQSAASVRMQTPAGASIRVPTASMEEDSPPPRGVSSAEGGSTAGGAGRGGSGGGGGGGGGGDQRVRSGGTSAGEGGNVLIGDPKMISATAAKEADKVKKQLLAALEGVQKVSYQALSVHVMIARARACACISTQYVCTCMHVCMYACMYVKCMHVFVSM